MGPIDPHQLLQSLSSLIHDDGGLKSAHDVAQVTNLMRDANKLVSRCVYVNILKSTKRKKILEKFIEVGGWEILYSWLVEANNSENNLFLLDILRVYKELPVTVDILKQNNSAKIIKTLSRGENIAVRKLSREVVSSWMTIIKNNQKINEILQTKKNIKEIDKNTEREEQIVLLESYKPPEKKKRRPKTVNVYQEKSRDVILDQEARKPIKKSVAIDKGKDASKRTGVGLNKLIEPIETKKKRPNLNVSVSPTSTASNSTIDKPKVVKPISPKARHVISESTEFMSALDAPAVTPTRKKRKIPFKPLTPTTPPPSATSTSPLSATPKPLFYKDDLKTAIELDDDSSLSIKDKLDCVEIKDNLVEDGEAKDFISDEEKKDSIETASILSNLCKKKKKKSVTWAEDVNLCQFFFFDLDEAEKMNVNHFQNFGDLKTQEMRLERQGFENAKRLLVQDKMTEKVTWFFPPLLDLSTPLIELGINSVEKEVQRKREQRVLQEIFFSKESLPDSPHEADLEFIDAEDPKIIPLEDENNPESYITTEPCPDSKEVSSLPPALANLVKSISSKQEPATVMPKSQDINKIQTVLGVMMGRGLDQLDMKIHPKELQNLKQVLQPFQGPPPPIGESQNFQGDLMNSQGINFPPKNLFSIAPPGYKPLGPSVPSGSYPQGPPPRVIMSDEMPFPNQNSPHLGPMRGHRMRPGRRPVMRGHGRGRGGHETICRYYSYPNGCYNNRCSYIHPGVKEPL